MKKIVLSLSLASCLISAPSFAHELALDTLDIVWSAENGGSFYLYGLSDPYASGTCGYIFQNTTDSSSLSNVDSSSFPVDADGNGMFNYTLSPDATGCNTVGNTFTLLVYCELSFGSDSVNAQRVYTGVCT